MISIREKDLKNFEKCGNGKYGVVYKVDDTTAYKIYREVIKDEDGFAIENPAIRKARKKINKYDKKRKNITLTEFPSDIILVNNTIRGVKIPYYDAETLDNLRDLSYTIKKDISRQLIDIHNELIKNRIYPIDYHLGNIMYTKDNIVRLIDLDDPLTHVCLFKDILSDMVSTFNLNEVIYNLFNYKRFYNIDHLITKRDISPGLKKNWYQELIKENEAEVCYLIINKNSDIEKIKDIAYNNKTRIILTVETKMIDNKETYNIIQNLNKNNIFVYDIVYKEYLLTYLTCYKADTQLEIDDNKVLQLK